MDHREGIGMQRESKPIRLNLGCGLLTSPGWVNVDGLTNPVFIPEVLMDFDQLLPVVPDAVAQAVYWSHGPEHVAPDGFWKSGMR
jgi:hypothetical protein